MTSRLRSLALPIYERLLEWEVSGAPNHVAVIQDGNRRYARERGKEASEGHKAGADTTEALLDWCDELDVREVTLYTFSTENFDRPEEQREYLFDLVETKLREFADADRVHEGRVRIRAIGELDMLPERVRDAIDYADSRTKGYDRLRLNVALAYGGRAELLGAAQDIAEEVDEGVLSPSEIDVEAVESRLYEGPTRDVDLIIRSGGAERTSNFLPWHANGNEAAVYFCAPYWPAFRKVDFLRAIRTYEHREASWRTNRARRAAALVKSLGAGNVGEARATLSRFRHALPSGEQDVVEEEIESASD